MTDPKQFTDVVYEVRDRAAWIIINRPKVYNAFRGQTLEELIQAFHLAANDRRRQHRADRCRGQGILHGRRSVGA
jgi:2-ketocyclohexanecarboxyl-CoA hydrolase